MLKCRKVEAELLVTTFGPCRGPWALQRALLDDLLLNHPTLVDNQERRRRARPGFSFLINSSWFLFQALSLPVCTTASSRSQTHLRPAPTPSQKRPASSPESLLLLSFHLRSVHTNVAHVKRHLNSHVTVRAWFCSRSLPTCPAWWGSGPGFLSRDNFHCNRHFRNKYGFKYNQIIG